METLNHVVKHCHHTEEARVKRRDCTVKYVASRLERQQCIFEIEPVYHTCSGNRKLIMVTIKDDTALVIDAQVRGDEIGLNRAHNASARYYGWNPDLAMKIW